MKFTATALLALVAQTGAFTVPAASKQGTALSSFNPNGTMQQTATGAAPATAAGKPMVGDGSASTSALRWVPSFSLENLGIY